MIAQLLGLSERFHPIGFWKAEKFKSGFYDGIEYSGRHFRKSCRFRFTAHDPVPRLGGAIRWRKDRQFSRSKHGTDSQSAIVWNLCM